MAAVNTLQHEIKFVRKAQDNVSRERDKLKSDLQVRNFESNMLQKLTMET